MFQDGKKKTISSTSSDHSAIIVRRRPTTSTTPAAAPQSQATGEVQTDSHWFPSLPFQQLQVLFDCALARLCIFPSRYLSAIGLSPVFSLGWNLPPTSSCNPKQLDSLHGPRARRPTGVSPSELPRSRGLGPRAGRTERHSTIRHKCQFTTWANGASLAVTGPILVSFFSSA